MVDVVLTGVNCLIGIVLVGVAVWQAVDTFHHGSLFKAVREWADEGIELGEWALARLNKLDDRIAGRLMVFIGKLLSCPFCLAHWFSLIFTAAYCATFSLPGVTPAVLIWLGAVKFATLCNDGFYSVTRLHSELEEEIELPSVDDEEKNDGA
jgi:hypothetical protein